MNKICHYRCFESDKRISMQIYADQLQAGMIDHESQLEIFQPQSSLEKYASNKFVMRYLRYWEYPRSVVKQKADIHHVIDHGYAHLLPKLSAGKKCITVHDLIPMLNWKGLISESSKNVIRKPFLNLHSLSFIKNYDLIICVSISTANDLVEHLSILPEKIRVIPPIINSYFKLRDIEEVDMFANKYNLDRTCKWVMISGVEFYKNLETSLKVLKELNKNNNKPIKLIKSGLPSKEFDRLVLSLGLESLVKCVFIEKSDELPLLYNFVDCLLFPSLYEGFGMPVAEALACGTPVVTTKRGSLPEVGGKLAKYIEPNDVGGLCKAVDSSINEGGLRVNRYKAGTRWVEQFREAKVGEKFAKVYHDLNK